MTVSVTLPASFASKVKIWQVRGEVASSGYLERRGAFDEYRLVGGRAAGREVELVARCRRYGKLRVVEIVEELFRGADHRLRVGDRSGHLHRCSAAGQHLDALLRGIIGFVDSLRIGVAVCDGDGVGSHSEHGVALLEFRERIPFLRPRFSGDCKREIAGLGDGGRGRHPGSVVRCGVDRTVGGAADLQRAVFRAFSLVFRGASGRQQGRRCH